MYTICIPKVVLDLMAAKVQDYDALCQEDERAGAATSERDRLLGRIALKNAKIELELAKVGLLPG